MTPGATSSETPEATLAVPLTGTPTSAPIGTGTASPTPSPTGTPTGTPTVGPLPEPPSGWFEVEAQDLVLGVVPGVLGLDRASGTLCVRVATNAPHGFRLILLRGDARPVDATPQRNNGHPTTRSARGEGELPYRVRAGVVPGACAEARSSQLPRADTLQPLGADGLVLVDASGPVSDGDIYEVAVALVAEANLDADAGTFLEDLRVLFEPRYR